ncbi:glycosyltransferase family 2 protein [Azonexus sp. R2A61]|uniref:glycosyltransferase family 2 protein n=1 Tax=Azonexus sp. R2A61 TaxID=2744443 RepID=UPI001F3B3E26|nr:glycosyltransferase family 2 protein [Azonexus sp. R2A61]
MSELLSSDMCELTILMPCLNEAATLATCIEKAKESISLLGVDGEILVADNGSTDGSQAIAHEMGARVVNIDERGYGAALQGGIAAARGTYVIMADADDSYAFDQLSEFYHQLKNGNELVMGNRFLGGIEEGAMPLLHRYLGNPVLSFIGRLFFKIPIGDFHCGLRGFSREKILALNLQTSGMEFASEMVIKSALAGAKICEVPTTLKPDGRGRPPHLRTWRDGWRHLRFMLLLSPRWLFFYPGLFMAFLGGIGSIWLLPGLRVIGGFGFDIHSLLYFSAIWIVGMQMLFLGVLARCAGVCFRILPSSGVTDWLLKKFRLEFGLFVAIVLLLVALLMAVKSILGWEVAGFSSLDPRQTMREVIPAAALGIFSMDLVAMSFWLTFLQFSSTRK